MNEKINAHRAKNPRCRTCCHTHKVRVGFGDEGWVCLAKNIEHRGKLFSTKLRGALCDLYTPRED